MTGSYSHLPQTILLLSLALRVWESTSEILQQSTSLTMIVNALPLLILSFIFSLSPELQINFGESDYRIEEDSGILITPITLQFRENQNPFTVILTPVEVGDIDSLGLRSFINPDNIGDTSRATAGEKTAMHTMVTFQRRILWHNKASVQEFYPECRISYNEN